MVGLICFWKSWKLSSYWLKTNLHNISHVLRRDLARGEFAPRVGSQCRLFSSFHCFDQQGRTLCSRRFLNLGITKFCLTLASFLNQCNGALMWQATIGQTRVLKSQMKTTPVLENTYWTRSSPSVAYFTILFVCLLIPWFLSHLQQHRGDHVIEMFDLKLI